MTNKSKITRFIPLLIIMLTACATPKYQYSFDHYRITAKSNATMSNDNTISVAPLAVTAEDMSASVEPALPSPRANTLTRKQPTTVSIQPAPRQRIHLTKADKKQLVQALKHLRRELHIKKSDSNYLAVPRDQATQKLDNEVILAIAFGAVGITLSLLGGISAAFWIAGVICLGVGVYFFIDWLQHR